jgi:hypothetical protein
VVCRGPQLGLAAHLYRRRWDGRTGAWVPVAGVDGGRRRGGIRAAHGRTHGADGGARARRSTRQGPPPPGRVPECAFSCGAGPSGGDARIVTAARCGTATCARVAFRDADGIIFLFIYLFIIYFGRRGGWNGLDWISASRSHWQVVAGELGNRSIDG